MPHSLPPPNHTQRKSRRFECQIDLALRSHFLGSICYFHVKSAINFLPWLICESRRRLVWVWGKRNNFASDKNRKQWRCFDWDKFLGNPIEWKINFSLLTSDFIRKFPNWLELKNCFDSQKVSVDFQALSCLIGVKFPFFPSSLNFRLSQIMEIGVERSSKRMKCDAHAWNWVT